MVLHGVLHDGQAKAGAAGLFGMTLIHTIEALKYLVLMFGRNTDTGILHTQQNFTGLLYNGHFYAATGIVVLNGIVAKVINDLVQQSTDTVDKSIIAGHFQRNIFQLCGIRLGDQNEGTLHHIAAVLDGLFGRNNSVNSQCLNAVLHRCHRSVTNGIGVLRHSSEHITVGTQFLTILTLICSAGNGLEAVPGTGGSLSTDEDNFCIYLHRGE